jgi:hypothetical protein
MSDGGLADLMELELLVWRFEHVRSSSGFQSVPPSGNVSRALTPEASLDLGSNFIELRFWEIRRPRLGWVCLTDAKQARRPRRGLFCDFRSPLRS